MEEKIENLIFLHQNAINEFNKIKEKIEQTETQDVRFKIETKHWYGYDIPHLGKLKHSFKISKYSANKLLETAIRIEKESIDKLIDKEIEIRINKIGKEK